jgi:endonuclease/exonuclease/phosphatase family metal-dependent hydrolase
MYLLAAFLGLVSAAAQEPRAQQASGSKVKVLTFNVWHGLRSGESNKRFPGEDADRMERRFQWQIDEIRRLDPDVLLLQEVNPNQRQARRYAVALGYDEIHKVTSCGLHLGFFYKIPRNVNEGLAILAKPELNLRRAGKKRLSGNAMCTASWGFQTKESRYGLFGVITVNGRPLLLTTTHLSAPPFLLPDFEDNLDRLVRDGTLEADQRAEILAERDRKKARNLGEVRALLQEMERRSRRLAGGADDVPMILSGDFNAEPQSEGIAAVKAAGFQHVGTGADFHTWDPVTNHVNYGIGTKRVEPLPTFGKPEVEELLSHRRTTPRQIDHLFVSPEVTPLSAEMVLNRQNEGIYPSDHFGILATVELP